MYQSRFTGITAVTINLLPIPLMSRFEALCVSIGKFSQKITDLDTLGDNHCTVKIKRRSKFNEPVQ